MFHLGQNLTLDSFQHWVVGIFFERFSCFELKDNYIQKCESVLKTENFKLKFSVLVAIFWPFTVSVLAYSHQVKRDFISNKISFVYQLLHELPNDFELTILGH